MDEQSTTLKAWDTTTPAAFPELDGIVYLTGASSELTRAAGRTDLGLLVTPASSVHRQLHHYELAGADNGLFNENHPTKGFTFDADAWLRWLDSLPRTGLLFAALPDVLNWYVDPETGATYPIGDFEATLERSARYVDTVASLGFPTALVAQDGLTTLADVPFAIDALFLGGSDDFKLGADAANLVAEANAAGLWTHMGRVNSLKRLRIAEAMGCKSADGTKIAFGPSVNAPKVIGWLDTLDEERAAR